MTDVALVPWQGPHQVLMTARDYASGALMVCLTFRTLSDGAPRIFFSGMYRTDSKPQP
jgi:hypothetical protein